MRGILFDGDRILLVRHHSDGRWYLPGGGVERGEMPEDALRREAREEAGAEVGPVALFGVVRPVSSRARATTSSSSLSRARPTAALPGQRETSAADFHPLAGAAGQPCLAGTRRRIDEYLAGAWPTHGRW